MSISYKMLAEISVGEDKLLEEEVNLDEALVDLEDRGLIGWDRPTNQYDLHPIVSGVAWNSVEKATKNEILENIISYIWNMPRPFDDWKEIESLKQLTPGIELYYALIRMQKFEDALGTYKKSLHEPLLYKLGENKVILQLMESLFSKEWSEGSKLLSESSQGTALHYLGMAYDLLGRPLVAVNKFTSALEHHWRSNNKWKLNWMCFSLSEMAGSLLDAVRGGVHDAFALLQSARRYSQSGPVNKALINWALIDKESENILEKIGQFATMSESENLSTLNLDNFIQEILADTPFLLQTNQLSYIHRLLGFVSMKNNDPEQAKNHLYSALLYARKSNLVKEETQALIDLSSLLIQLGELNKAKELATDALFISENNYPLLQSEVYYLLAEAKLIDGSTKEAVEFLKLSYRTAWCDGYPFSYIWILKKAKSKLLKLNFKEPVGLNKLNKKNYPSLLDFNFELSDNYYKVHEEVY